MLTFYWIFFIFFFKEEEDWVIVFWQKNGANKLNPSVSFGKSSQGMAISNIIYGDGLNQTVLEATKKRENSSFKIIQLFPVFSHILGVNTARRLCSESRLTTVQFSFKGLFVLQANISSLFILKQSI